MNSPILIHSSNIPFKLMDDFEDEDLINFAYISSQTIDQYISENIITELKDKSFDKIFIKDNLSSNYLELYGLRVAYHIRLCKELGEKRFVPIVILSDIDSYMLNKFDPMARILFTKDVFIIKNTQEAVKQFQAKKLTSKLTEDNYKSKFLDLVEVKAPENSSSHSITNEWAIERWASVLGISDKKTIVTNKDKISSMLYIKYLNNKYQVETAYQIETISQNKEIKGKLLFIDDKGKDGWSDIVESFLKQHYKNIKFKTLEKNDEDTNAFTELESIKNNIEFKTLEKNDVFSTIKSIKDEVKETIKDYDPNIILLDLRLLSNEPETISKISGVEILKYIKELNPSIQVIMFTASNDSLVLDTIFSIGALGYVKKDAPTDKYKASENSFDKLNRLIKESSEKIYLQDICKMQKEILHSNIINGNQVITSERMKKIQNSKFKKKFKYTKQEERIQELQTAVETVFNVLNSNMPRNFTFAMLSIYKCIEIICTYYIEEKEKSKKVYQSYWRGTTEEIGSTNTPNKIAKVKKRFNIEYSDSLFYELNSKRKETIHPSNLGKSIDITKDNIIEWFGLVKTIVIKLKIN